MLKRLRTAALVLVVSLLSLFILDSILIVLDLLPPTRLPGDALVGFRDPVGTGLREVSRSPHWRYVASDTGLMVANERGFRSNRSIRSMQDTPAQLRICVLGDSHTDLPYKQEYTHPFVMEKALAEILSMKIDVLNAGRGRYSPLQSGLLYTHFASDLHPQVIVLNLYTGNDFFDMLRVDDRPYYVPDREGGYEVHPPKWFKHADPDRVDSWFHSSRVVYVVESLLDYVGIRPIVIRIQYLRAMSNEFGVGKGSVFAYLWDLSRVDEQTLAYPPAYAAQILNQHLFFRRFPDALKESLTRMQFLLGGMRKENPHLMLVLSPIPSAVLSGSLQSDSLFHRKLAALGVDYGGLLSEESALYDSVLAIAGREGWVVIDNREVLREPSDGSTLFLNEDLHLSPVGSGILGNHQAGILSELIRKGRFGGL